MIFGPIFTSFLDGVVSDQRFTYFAEPMSASGLGRVKTLTRIAVASIRFTVRRVSGHLVVLVATLDLWSFLAVRRAL